MMTSASSASQKIVQTSFACFATLSFIIISGKKKRVAEHNEAWHTNDIWHHIDMYSTPHLDFCWYLHIPFISAANPSLNLAFI